MKKSNTFLRVMTAISMIFIAGIVATCEYYNIPATRWCGLLIGIGALIEFYLICKKQNKNIFHTKDWSLILFGILLCVLCLSFYFVGTRPWIILLLLMTIAGADIGAWLFGKIIGGDKMWERLSANKTWAGQIGGIICGTFMCVLYGLLGTDVLRPELIWIGIGISLLSQYGDLTASAIKRHLNIKDFSNLLPGHGGILDRFDGWLYVLPLIWLILELSK